MQDGNEPSIIERWIEFVSALPDERSRSNLAALVLVFAEAADQRETWAKALKGFNTMKSAIYETSPASLQITQGWLVDSQILADE